MTRIGHWLSTTALALALFSTPLLAQDDGGSAFGVNSEFGSSQQSEAPAGSPGVGGGVDNQPSRQGSAPANADIERYQDWGVRCGTRPQGNQERCEMFQQLTRDDSENPVMRILIGFPPGEDQAAAAMILPLGILIQPGISIRVDNGEPTPAPIKLCVADGCRTSFRISPRMLEQMKAGKRAYVRVKDPRGESVDLPISLSGFTNAYAQLKQSRE